MAASSTGRGWPMRVGRLAGKLPNVAETFQCPYRVKSGRGRLGPLMSAFDPFETFPQ